ncbi:MAG: multidrug efflux SMR transporter [Candidatus Methanomethylophilaceae archaeon]|nr:multidrug efflux SMR transporter [Candidatus Methanomethylophilaceae archaeon]MBR2348366.1 multidrug efflux SMR transporter [Candidatus Methanomethylophilaceae archaeon]MBR2394845.1 multidrug efflux SMR transporter [Candidatus Methanomethylophilaceae archaeon]
MDIAWIYLIAACILEPIWVICLERSDNFKKLGWGIVTLVTVLSCLYLLSLAVLSIGPGMAYSILAGIGSIGAVVAGIILYKDPMNKKKILYISLIIIGVIGVRLTSGGML